MFFKIFVALLILWAIVSTVFVFYVLDRLHSHDRITKGAQQSGGIDYADMIVKGDTYVIKTKVPLIDRIEKRGWFCAFAVLWFAGLYLVFGGH